MLSSFLIRNFRSILDMEVNMSFAEGKAPNGYKDMDTFPFLEVGKERLVPCLSIYGPNASGKTNVIKALGMFTKIVTTDIKGNYIPNRLNTKYSATCFEIKAIVDSISYSYLIEYDDKKIIREKLRCNEDIVFSIEPDNLNFDKVITDSYDDKKIKNIYEVECCDANRNQQTTFLNKIAKNYSLLNRYISELFDYINNSIKVHGTNNLFPFYGFSRWQGNIGILQDKEAFVRIAKLLQKLDIDIYKLVHERTKVPVEGASIPFTHMDLNQVMGIEQNEDGIFKHNVYSFHKDVNGNEVRFNLKEESEGTQIAAELLGVLLDVLDTGKILVIDEIDSSLHPLILIELIRLFKDKRYNKNGAQIIFTIHNTDVLDEDLLRVSEISIVSKTIDRGSIIRKVSDFDGVRNVSNFRRQYLNGNFSGIPHPYI